MKKFLIALMIVSVNAYANIDYSPSGSGKASAEEISRSRACFEELKVQGCGDPGDEDIEHFRSCLKNVIPSLTDNCKKMMTELYID